MAIKYVPGRWVTPKTTPAWWASGAYGTPRRRYEKPHYVDTRTGAWVQRPGTRGTGPGPGGSGPPAPPPGPQTLSDEEIRRRANLLADAQLGASSAAIERARAAAQAQADRDSATYQALGTAQMGMISKIPANIQGIRNTAGAAISQFGNQLSGAAAQQLQGEQATNAGFEASQTGMTPNGPGPGAAPDGAIGVNAQAAMAASAQMGGTIPARQQAEIGAASAMAAEGMPAVVARATQDQVAMRMSQAAVTDADYRQQLIDLAATRGGIFMDAYNNLYDIETKKVGVSEANARLKLDQDQFDWKKQQDVLDRQQSYKEFDLKKKAYLDAQVAAHQKTKAQAAKEWRDYQLAVRRVRATERGGDISQQNANTATNAAIAKAEADAAKLGRYDATKSNSLGFRVNGYGEPILKNGKKQYLPGFKAGPHGTTVKVGTAAPVGKKGGIKLANDMAAKFRGDTPRSVHTVSKAEAGKGQFVNKAAGERVTIINAPKVDYGDAFIQIRDQLMGRGYPRKEAEAIAHNALNARYGPTLRPGKQR